MIERILLIDDDPIQNLINSKMIKKMSSNTELIIAGNGQEALEKIHQDALPLQIIFLDINMPIMDGWEFLESLSAKNNDNSLKIFMLTSSVSPDDIKRSQTHGLVQGFITKPLSMEKLRFLNEMD